MFLLRVGIRLPQGAIIACTQKSWHMRLLIFRGSNQNQRKNGPESKCEACSILQEARLNGYYVDNDAEAVIDFDKHRPATAFDHDSTLVVAMELSGK
jgi:hypothetical protein